LVKYKSPHYKSTHGDDIFFGMVIGEKNGRLKVVAPSARCVELLGEQIQTGWDSSCPHDTISVSSIICLESQLLTEEAAAEEAAMVIGEKNDRLKVVAPSARCVELLGEQIQTGWASSCPEEAAAAEEAVAAEEAAVYDRWLDSNPSLKQLQVGARRVSPRRTPGGDGQKK
jgi:hypothetical protein